MATWGLARQLPTVELGSIRYDEACKTGKWPIEIVWKGREWAGGMWGSVLGPDGAVVAEKKLALHGGEYVCEVLAEVGEWSVEIVAGGRKVLWRGRVGVEVGDEPWSNVGRVAQLAEREGSGAIQTAMAGSKGAVNFTFAEVPWAKAVEVAVGPDVVARLNRGDDGVFRGRAELGLGRVRFRFRVDTGEGGGASGPMTRLGWDMRMRTGRWLVTREIQIRVKDLSSGGDFGSPARVVLTRNRPGSPRSPRANVVLEKPAAIKEENLKPQPVKTMSQPATKEPDKVPPNAPTREPVRELTTAVYVSGAGVTAKDAGDVEITGKKKVNGDGTKNGDNASSKNEGGVYFALCFGVVLLVAGVFLLIGREKAEEEEEEKTEKEKAADVPSDWPDYEFHAKSQAM